MNLNKLRDKAYRNAVAHGWHEENLSNEHLLCLLISELMEAVEADRKGWYANVKRYNEITENSLVCKSYNTRIPKEKEYIIAYEETIKDSVEDELADACIRLLDFAGLREYDLDSFDYEGSGTEDYSRMSLTESMYRICVYVTDRSYSKDICIILNEIFAFCRSRNIAIFWYIEQKMKYNELRPYKHGNKKY